MLKGFLGSLVAAALFFAAGAISIAFLGTNTPIYTYETTSVEWDGEVVMINEEVVGEKTWYFDDVTELNSISVHSSGVKTYIAPSADNRLSVCVKTDGWKNVSVNAECPYNEHLDLSVGGEKLGGFISLGDNSSTVTICVPDKVYSNLYLDLDTGSLEARGIRADGNMFNVGSGSFEYEQAAGFTADNLTLDMGSGSVKIANAASTHFKIDMGSGNFDISGLTGTGSIDIGSGSGTAEFAMVSPGRDVFHLGSGKLTVYIPESTRADLHTDIGSGVVSVDCCGVSQNIRDDSHITFNGGSNDDNSFRVDLGSGKVEFRNSSEYKRPNMFSDFPNSGDIVSGFAFAEQEENNSGFEATFSSAHIVEATDFGVISTDSFDAELIGSVTMLEADSYYPNVEYAWGTTETTLYRQYMTAGN